MEAHAGKEPLEKEPIRQENVQIQEIDTSEHPEYKNHEHVFKITAPAYSCTAFVAIHNTALGPSEGGIRYKYYNNEDEAITDVLRLSEGMTLKNAPAGLSAGGGKSVIMAQDGQPKPNEIVLQIIAHALNQINTDQTLYYGAQDMNISEEHLNYMLGFTKFLKGATPDNPDIVGGDPSPLTALGVLEAIKFAIEHKFNGQKTLKDLTISLQGIGGVGAELARLLFAQGATLIASDANDTAFEALRAEGIILERVGLEDIYDTKADIFAPNAIGGILSNDTIPRLAAAGVKIVCGAANNQQRDQVNHIQSKIMQEHDILYCPDFIVNAGGIIWVNQVGENTKTVRARIRTQMPDSLRHVIELSQKTGHDMGHTAEEYALSLIQTYQNNQPTK